MSYLLYLVGLVSVRRLPPTETTIRLLHRPWIVPLASGVRTFIVVLIILVVGYGLAWTVVPLLAWFTPVIAFIALVVMILRVPTKIERDRAWLTPSPST